MGGRPRVSCDIQKLRDHMAYNFRIQLMKVCAGGVLGSDIGCVSRKIRARIGGLSCPPDHPRSLPIGILMSGVKRGGFVLSRD